MIKQKLNVRFHNPNMENETIDYISQVFIEASKTKFKNILRETVVIKPEPETDAFTSAIAI